MKIIKVESCRECPYYVEFGYAEDCRLAHLFNRDEDDLPEWCPLEDEE